MVDRSCVDRPLSVNEKRKGSVGRVQVQLYPERMPGIRLIRTDVALHRPCAVGELAVLLHLNGNGSLVAVAQAECQWRVPVRPGLPLEKEPPSLWFETLCYGDILPGKVQVAVGD